MRFLILVSIGYLAACSAPTEPDIDVTIGAIAGYRADDPQITIEPVEGATIVRVSTYGNSCYSIARTDVAIAGRTAVVTPYDQIDLTGVCLDLLKELVHEIRVDFGRPGPATIVVTGFDRSLPSDGDSHGAIIAVEHEVAIP